jgi:hypothetical protein
MAEKLCRSHNIRCVKFGNTELATSVRKSRGRRIERLCRLCGATFWAIARHIRFGRGQFCSRSCATSYHARLRNAIRPPVGPANGNWKGGVARDHYRYTKRFRAKSPEKYRAQKIAQHAIRSGALVRPDACSQCGVGCKPHGHHDDYTKPLELRWLCRACHLKHHNALRRAS